MKRIPQSTGDRQIIHVATDTGDLERFVLSPENFDPEVIAIMLRMETEPIQGYRLAVVRTDAGLEFTVVRDADGASLTHNLVCLDDWPPFLQLETTPLASMSRPEARILADLEQCAAIALTAIDPREPWRQPISSWSGECGPSSRSWL